jgi:hypothetical protein
MEPTRCARLILTAAAAGQQEAWIAKQPELLFVHLFQYFPVVTRYALMPALAQKYVTELLASLGQ